MSEETSEKAIHDLVRGLAEKVLEGTGIKIDKIQFEWVDNGDFDDPGFILKSVHMATTTI